MLSRNKKLAIYILLVSTTLGATACGGNSGNSGGTSPTLTSIAVTPATGSIQIGSTESYTATGAYSDGSHASLTSAVTWASSSMNVATITSAGVATGLAAGSTHITAAVGAITSSPVALSVTTPIAVTFQGVAPLAVAEQIGTGAWAAASLQNNQLSLALPQGTTTYSIAYVCPTEMGMGPLNNEYIIQATVQDGTAYSQTCFNNPTTGSATGSVDASAIAGTATVVIYGAGLFQTSVTGATGTFNATLENGINDIAAVAFDASSHILAVKIVRSQTVPGAVNGGNTITFAASDAVTQQTIAITNIPAGFNPAPAVSAEYETANHTFFYLNGSSSTQYAVVPSTEAHSGDYYSFSANDAGGTHQAIFVFQNATTAGAATLPLPTPLAYAAPAAAAFPSFNLSYSGFSGDAAIAYSANIQWFVNTSTLELITVTATSAYQNGATTLAIPNLTGISGFLQTAASGTTVYWRASAYGGTYQSFMPAPSSSMLSLAVNSSTYVEP